jgi:hypothetical protein
MNSADASIFHWALMQFWNFLVDDPLITGILEDLNHRSIEYEEQADMIFKDHAAIVFESEREAVETSYRVIRKCIEAQDQPNHEREIGHGYSVGGKHADAIDFFRSHFVEPLYEYIDEHLDDRRAMLAMLERYKQTCEWFQRDVLLKTWTSATADPAGYGTGAHDIRRHGPS